MNDVILCAKNLSKKFESGLECVDILQDVNLEIKSGELVSISGKSGSGKSTLLYILSSLLKPDTGSVFINDMDIYSLSKKELYFLRNREIGFVFQDSMMIDEISIEENILLPLEIRGGIKPSDKKRCKELAESVLINNCMKQKAITASTGERARAGLLRAIMQNPLLVFLDEPTGTLDSDNARLMEDIIVNMSKNLNMSFVYVTHDEPFAKRAKRHYEIKDRGLTLAGENI